VRSARARVAGRPFRNFPAVLSWGIDRGRDALLETSAGTISGASHSLWLQAIPSGSDTLLFAGTQTGCYRTTDAGQTWQHTLSGGRVFAMAVVPGAAGEESVFIGTQRDGILRSDDGGLTWKRLTNGIPARFRPYVDAIDVDPSRPAHVALADTEGNVFESQDSGESWRQTAQVPPVRRLLVVPD